MSSLGVSDYLCLMFTVPCAHYQFWPRVLHQAVCRSWGCRREQEVPAIRNACCFPGTAHTAQRKGSSPMVDQRPLDPFLSSPTQHTTDCTSTQKPCGSRQQISQGFGHLVGEWSFQRKIFGFHFLGSIYPAPVCLGMQQAWVLE